MVNTRATRFSPTRRTKSKSPTSSSTSSSDDDNADIPASTSLNAPSSGVPPSLREVRETRNRDGTANKPPRFKPIRKMTRSSSMVRRSQVFQNPDERSQAEQEHAEQEQAEQEQASLDDQLMADAASFAPEPSEDVGRRVRVTTKEDFSPVKAVEYLLRSQRKSSTPQRLDSIRSDSDDQLADVEDVVVVDNADNDVDYMEEGEPEAANALSEDESGSEIRVFPKNTRSEDPYAFTDSEGNDHAEAQAESGTDNASTGTPPPASSMHEDEASLSQSVASNEPALASSALLPEDGTADQPQTSPEAHGLPEPTAKDLRTVFVRSEGLGTMLRSMGGPLWTGEGSMWHRALAQTGDSDFKDWFLMQTFEMPKSLRSLIRYNHVIWHLFSNAPRQYVNDVVTHLTYFKESGRERRLNGCVNELQNLVDHICRHNHERNTRMQGDAKGIAQKAIPMLILTVQAIFTMGSRKKLLKTGPLPPTIEADFTEPTLQVLKKLIKWIQRLHRAMSVHQLATDKEAVRRGHLLRHVGNLGKAVEVGLVSLEEQDEEAQFARSQQMVEKDNRQRINWQDQVQARKEAQDRQMALFLASTQGMGKGRIPMNYQSYRSRISTIHPRTKTLTKEGYRLQNRGWDWDEDNKLMNILKRARDMDLRAIARKIPRHDIRDIQQRIVELKRKAQQSLRRKTDILPIWCL